MQLLPSRATNGHSDFASEGDRRQDQAARATAVVLA